MNIIEEVRGIDFKCPFFFWVSCAIIFVVISGCGTVHELNDAYEPYFGPDDRVLNLCGDPVIVAAEDIGSTLRYRRSGFFCPSYKGLKKIPLDSSVGGSTAWGRYDGGFGLAGSVFSVYSSTAEKRLIEERAELARLSKLSSQSVPIEFKLLEKIDSNGLDWEVQERKYFFDRDDVSAKSDKRYSYTYPVLKKYEITYVYRDPAGWWISVRGIFDGRMFFYPEILASRLSTLRAIVRSVELQPLNRANIECSFQEKLKRKICYYNVAP
ncbi:hypothetical protein [Xanthomonas arboricola]|uniref:hypothetical protein n=1 Tax=Xanthomonas arboricola TaxID=56448 RepID=UPI001431B836|nr:hypothetical protein [Xanthomonas arboricola]NJB91789.1 hypothetical protein [Xanthomonas arboricola]